MKKILLSIIALSLAFQLFAQDKLEFIQDDWAAALEKAAAEKKYIVLDAYTEWCGWCKVMDKKTFTDPEVIDYYSRNFVPVRIDMEKGIGKDLTMKYRVSAFPSILYFNSEGRLIYRTMGYREANDFLLDGQAAMDGNKQFKHPGDPSKLNPGFPDFYIDSYKKGKEREWPEQEQVIDFLRGQEDRFGEVSWSLMKRFSLDQEFQEFFLENMGRYAKYYGDIEVNDKFNTITYMVLRRAIEEKDEDILQESIDMLYRYGSIEDSLNTAPMYRIHYFEQLEKWNEYSELVLKRVEKDELNNRILNDYAWNFYEHIDDTDAINKAIEWMSKVIRAEPDYAYVDTYAALLFKAGRLDEAEEYAREAIKIGKEDKSNIDDTRELLDKIREAKKQ